MIKLTQKSCIHSAFDMRLIKMMDSFVLSVDTLPQFEAEFARQLEKVQGFGDRFKASYFTENKGAIVGVKYRNQNGSCRLLFEATDTRAMKELKSE